MKAFGFFIVILFVFVSYQGQGQNLKGFYSQLTQLNLPYNFSYEMHKYNSEVDLPSSIVDQDPILRNFKAVAKVDLDNNYNFILVKRVFEDGNDNIFFLMTLNQAGTIVSSFPVDVTGDDGGRMDFKITADKKIQVVTYDNSSTGPYQRVKLFQR